MTAAPKAGVSLLEAVVALAVIAVALTLALPLLALEMRLERRLEARREVRALVELAEQRVRETGDHRAALAVVVEAPPEVARDVVVAARILPQPTAGLFRLEIDAAWRVGNQADRFEVATLVWWDR